MLVFLLWTSSIAAKIILLSSLATGIVKADEGASINIDPIHAVNIVSNQWWSRLHVISDQDYHDGLYMPNYWAISISSNETILNSGGCPLFHKFVCSSPNCYEDNKSLYSQDFPYFSTRDATRLNLTTQIISIAGGAWQINSPALYLHNCETFLIKESGHALGQIGLGLSGEAYRNFQTPSLIFSVFLHTMNSGELIFGLNSTYVDDSATPISLLCDTDWKIKINSVGVGNLTLVSSPATVIFDLETPDISLPQTYFTLLRDYFFSISDPGSCIDKLKHSTFICFGVDSLQNFPPLQFNLENGEQFLLTPTAYTEYYWNSLYIAKFTLYNSTFSGTEYIILGRTVVFQYYTVFEQLRNQTPTITLYPVIRSSLDLGLQRQPEVAVESNNPDPTGPLSNMTLDMSPLSNSSETINSQPQSPYDSNITQAENKAETPYDSIKRADNSLYAIFFVILVVLICGILAYFCLKRRRATHDKMIKEHKPTFELNGSSYFVSTNENVCEHHESYLSE